MSANLESLFLLIGEKALYVGFYLVELRFAVRQQLLGALDLRGELVYFEFAIFHGRNDGFELGHGLLVGESFLGHCPYYFNAKVRISFQMKEGRLKEKQ